MENREDWKEVVKKRQNKMEVWEGTEKVPHIVAS